MHTAGLDYQHGRGKTYINNTFDIKNLTIAYIKSVEETARHTAPEPLRSWDKHILEQVEEYTSIGQSERGPVCFSRCSSPHLCSCVYSHLGGGTGGGVGGWALGA